MKEPLADLNSDYLIGMEKNFLHPIIKRPKSHQVRYMIKALLSTGVMRARHDVAFTR